MARGIIAEMEAIIADTPTQPSSNTAAPRVARKSTRKGRLSEADVKRLHSRLRDNKGGSLSDLAREFKVSLPSVIYHRDKLGLKSAS